MAIATTSTAGLFTLPDPPKDRPGKPVPERIAAMLSLVAVLAEYGRHLAETIEQIGRASCRERVFNWV